jgi:hypothetical protein
MAIQFLDLGAGRHLLPPPLPSACLSDVMEGGRSRRTSAEGGGGNRGRGKTAAAARYTEAGGGS